jgi:hypothetical protein
MSPLSCHNSNSPVSFTLSQYRYTAIADATVHREYFEALDRVKQRYTLAQPELAAVEAAAPDTQLEDLIRWVSAHLCVGSAERAGRLLAEAKAQQRR